VSENWALKMYGAKRDEISGPSEEFHDVDF
jgi:hypothetical protein